MIKNSVYRIYFARCMNIFNSLLAQLVKYDVHTTRKTNSIHAVFYHIYINACRQQYWCVARLLILRIDDDDDDDVTVCRVSW